MSKTSKIEAFFEKEKPFKKEVLRLREIITRTELEEDFKWGAPTYTINGKNVIGIGSFKHHYGIWFFNGALLKDTNKLLHNAQEGKTKALRQLRFTKEDDFDPKTITAYLTEAIENQKAGREIKIDRSRKKVEIPEALKIAFQNDKGLEKAFMSLTAGKQREYADHIATAKQEKTRQRRLAKCVPMIIDGKGLHDKYKNC